MVGFGFVLLWEGVLPSVGHLLPHCTKVCKTSNHIFVWLGWLEVKVIAVMR